MGNRLVVMSRAESIRNVVLEELGICPVTKKQKNKLRENREKSETYHSREYGTVSGGKEHAEIWVVAGTAK